MTNDQRTALLVEAGQRCADYAGDMGTCLLCEYSSEVYKQRDLPHEDWCPVGKLQEADAKAAVLREIGEADEPAVGDEVQP